MNYNPLMRDACGKVEGSATALPDGFSGGNQRWYVAMTQPRKERFAQANLSRQKFHNFLPTHEVMRNHAGKYWREKAPVFPGYIFVRFDIAAAHWSAVNGTFGVQRLIAVGGCPAPVKAGIVEALMHAEESRSEISRRRPAFSRGDKVRLIEGPFAGELATLEHLDASGRVRLLMNWVGAAVKVLSRQDMLTLAR